MSEQELPLFFGEWLKGYRKALDLTQAELAQRASCTVFALRKIEAGNRRPSKQLAGLLAKSLQIPPEDHPTFIRVARGELSIERLCAPSPSRTSFHPSKPEPVAPRSNLPSGLMPMVGREVELAALHSLISNPKCRLLSITGMGGVGKTRLAIEVAAQLQGLFPGGVYFVPLASLYTAEFLAPAIAESLDLPLSGELDPHAQLLNRLRSRTSQDTLLVLDNLEHLLATNPAADVKTDAVVLLTDLLKELAHLKILVTSRERINVQGEWMFELKGLPFPAHEQSSKKEKYSATELFILRARQLNAAFDVHPDEWPALVRICQFVDGIPLAIELAAAWTGMLSTKEIAQEIESNLDFLNVSMRDIPERHRSLRATFEHSWRLLSAEEQQVLRRLAVFRGGFQREAAEQVAGASLNTLMSLFEKSLLLRKKNGRYDLHEVVRKFALLHLSKTPDHAPALESYCKFYLEFAQEQEKALEGPSQSAAMEVLGLELDNLRAALEWGLQTLHPECTLKIVASLGRFWYTRGYWHEGLEWIERGLDCEGDLPVEVKAKALTVAGWLNRYQGNYSQATANLQESIALWEQIGDPIGLIHALTHLAASWVNKGDLNGVSDLLDRALSLARQQDYRLGIYTALGILGSAVIDQGESQRGIALYQEALSLAREAGDASQIARLLNLLGVEHIVPGSYNQAEEYLIEGEQICRDLGYRHEAAYMSGNRAYIATKKGNFAQAYTHLCESMRVMIEVGDKNNCLLIVILMASVAQELGYPERAALLLGACEALNRAWGVTLSQPNQSEFDLFAAGARSQMSEAAFAQAWEEGSSMPFEKVISYSLEWDPHLAARPIA